MKRTLKYLLKRETYNQTKKAFRELERSGGNREGSSQTGPETRMSADRATVDSDSDPKSVLQTMDDYEFEQFIRDLWERMGWRTDVSTQLADKGIDVVATRQSPYEEKALIQAKRYGPNTTVGSPDIQQYASLKQQRHGVDKVLVVTTNGFSRQAEETAHQLNVKLVDGDDLVGLVEELDVMDLVENYVPEVARPEPEPESLADPTATAASAPSVESESPAGPQRIDPLQDEATATEPRFETENEGPLASRLPDERWKWVAGATALWLLGIAFAGADLGFVMLLAWVGLPYAILKDGHWTRWRRWYAAAAALLPVFAVFVGAWYLLMRWRAVGFESAADGVESDETVTGKQQNQHAVGSKDAVGDCSYDHYTDAVEDVKQLKRERRYDEAESLLWWCIEAAEKQAVERGYDTVPPWYYRHLAIVYRKQGRHVDEAAILERYIERGGRKDELVDRLETARNLAS